MKTLLLTAALLGAASASATTIDFTAYAPGTPVTTISGIAFALSGGPDTATTPITANVFGDPTVSLTNAATGAYPTQSVLSATFNGTASGISFTYNNYGEGNTPSYTALDAKGNVVSTGALTTNDFTTVTSILGSGIKTLEFDNGYAGANSWEFGVGELTFSASGAPEAATWAMMIAGFGLVGVAARRRTALTAA